MENKKIELRWICKSFKAKINRNLEVNEDKCFILGGWREWFQNCWEWGGNNEFEVLCMTYVIRTAWKLCLRQKKKKVYINLHRGI